MTIQFDTDGALVSSRIGCSRLSNKWCKSMSPESSGIRQYVIVLVIKSLSVQPSNTASTFVRQVEHNYRQVFFSSHNSYHKCIKPIINLITVSYVHN